MKYFNTLVLALIFSSLIFAQEEEETLLNMGEIENGYFGALSVKVDNVKNNNGVWVGGKGGWIINHTFVIGGGGYGLASRIKGDPVVQTLEGKELYLQVGYGGFLMEYVHNSNKLLHYSVQTLIGAGGAGYSLKDDYDTRDGGEASFFVWENSVFAELNVVQYFRIGFGGSYRMVSGLELEGITDSDLSGFSANIVFKFGRF